MLSYGVMIMTKKEVIEQLESLKANQRDFVEKEEMTDIFYRDIKAIERSIELIKEREEIQKYYISKFYEIFDIILSLDYEKNSKKDIKNVMYQLYDIYKKEM